MLKIIRKEDAEKIEATWHYDLQKVKHLTSNYVLGNNSLAYFRKCSAEVEDAFRKFLFTETESVIRNKGYIRVNDTPININVSKEKANSYTITLYDNDVTKILRQEVVNRFVLQTIGDSYGYLVRNKEYLAAYHYLFAIRREAIQVFSYLIMEARQAYIYFTPITRIVYKDGSKEHYTGVRTIDNLKDSPYRGHLKQGVKYYKDLLKKDSKYQVLEGSLF